MDKADLTALNHDAAYLRELSTLPAWKLLKEQYGQQILDGLVQEILRPGTSYEQYCERRGEWWGVYRILALPERITQEAHQINGQLAQEGGHP